MCKKNRLKNLIKLVLKEEINNKIINILFNKINIRKDYNNKLKSIK